MKDLRHMYEFERLLEDEANNELVREAKDSGLKCIGSVCYQIPEVLINLPGTFSVRLRAPRTGSIDMGTYYMTSYLCEYTRALLERAIEGGYNFLDCVIAPDGCSMLNRCVENMELLKTNDKEDFFYEHLEAPMKADENALNLYISECREKVLKPQQEHFGIDISDDAMRKSVELHNKVCRLITAIGDYRKEENPRITGYEFHLICMATYVCPKEPLIPMLEDTLEELKTREPDKKPPYRARVELVGSEVDDVDMVKIIEEAGALVVADRFCFGSLPGRDEIILNDDEDVLTQICRHYLMSIMCPRHMDMPKIKRRREYVDELAKEYHADGIIYEQMKFCDPWAYERMTGTYAMHEEKGYPVLSIDRPYVVSTMGGQLRTRVQAFVEGLEIKNLQKGER